VLHGYCDESFGQEGISGYSCIFSEGSTWLYLCWEWEKVIERTNVRLASQGRKTISRYHASDCSSRKGEFEGWSTEEDQIPFSQALFAVLRRFPLNAVGVTLDTRELVREIPEAANRVEAFTYAILMLYMMMEVGRFFAEYRDIDARIALTHERCKYDGILQQCFNSMIERQDLLYKNHFLSLTADGWENCTELLS